MLAFIDRRLALLCLIAVTSLGCVVDETTPTARPPAPGAAGVTAVGVGAGPGGGVTPRCGNFAIDPGEVCDDGNTGELSMQDFCSADCSAEMIHSVADPTTVDTPYVARYLADGRVVWGVVCIPPLSYTYSSPAPVLVDNHDGFAGFQGAQAADLCHVTDPESGENGYVRVFAQSRGQPDPPVDANGNSIDGAMVGEGEVEVCLGEVSDVAALVRAVLRRDEVAKDAVYALGFGIGGCVSLQLAARAAQLGLPPLRGVASFAAPTDFVSFHAHALAGAPVEPVLGAVVERLEAASGPPGSNPAAYAARSVIQQAAVLVASKTPLMISHGTADPIVPLSQGCALHTRLRQLGADPVDIQSEYWASAISDPLTEPSCADVVLEPVARLPYHERYYFMPLLGADHTFDAELREAFVREALGFFATHPDAP